jgi:hypothetical protein
MLMAIMVIQTHRPVAGGETSLSAERSPGKWTVNMRYRIWNMDIMIFMSLERRK